MGILDDVLAHPSYAVVRLRDEDTVHVLAGPRTDLDRLADAPLRTGTPSGSRAFDTLLAVPYRQAHERGFAAIDDGTPLSAIALEHQRELSLEQALTELPHQPPVFADRGGFDVRRGLRAHRRGGHRRGDRQR